MGTKNPVAHKAFSISPHLMDTLLAYFTASAQFPVFLEEVISLNGAFQQIPLKRVQLKQVMLIMRRASHIRQPCSAKVKHTRTHTLCVRSDGAGTLRET